MRIRDTLKLAKWELKIGIKECVVSLMIQCVLLACIIFSLSLFCGIDDVVDNYLRGENTEPYKFQLRNFDEGDKAWLYKNGFFFFCYDDDENIILASTNSISNIWSKKIYALINGKDIWNEETDKIIEVILFGKIVLGALVIILAVLMISNILNSIELKMLDRNYYKSIISSIGMRKKDVKDVYLSYFLCRSLVVVLLAELIYWAMNTVVNNYIDKIMKINFCISFRGMENAITGVLLFSVTFLACSRRVIVKNEI